MATGVNRRPLVYSRGRELYPQDGICFRRIEVGLDVFVRNLVADLREFLTFVKAEGPSASSGHPNTGCGRCCDDSLDRDWVKWWFDAGISREK